MSQIGSRFDRVLRRVPGIAVGVLAEGEVVAIGAGTLADAADPADLVWEIGSITKAFTGVLLAEMSRGPGPIPTIEGPMWAPLDGE
jgi:CubicO group peptidase (beta-lactamase class C family)